MLKQIDKSDIQKITSGQVIIDLLSITKELVENSIDANSDIIELTFREYGESIEISDNGHGIDPQDFDSLCLKHYTSKISRFEDLDLVKTLGFRGEALSSICAVSTVEIITGNSKLEYDHMGNLKLNQTLKQNQVGVNVTVCNLFKDFPVRQKNYIKNIKKEFNKMLMFIYNYMIINPHIKFVVNNYVNGKKKPVISTQKTKSPLSNFIIIYGTKAIESLKPIEMEITSGFRISGFISSISIGRGRSVKDKQHLFLNSRPIIHKDVTRLINSVYNQFNNLQFPVFIINLLIDTDVDVNLNPNKTLINFNQDLGLLEQKLVEYWEEENMGQQLEIVKPKKEDPSVRIVSIDKKRNHNEGPKPKRFKLSNYLEAPDFKTHNLTAKLDVFPILIKKPLGPRPLKAYDDNENTPLIEKEITVSKLQFNDMELIGQFNLGFILTKLHDNIFIIDQHASDEKYNYESLKNSIKINNQQLIQPINLQLNLIERQKIIEYKHIIESNGFKLNEDFDVTHLPVYKNIQFDTEDLLELLNQLPEQKILPKIKLVIALKACRKSIMIGDHLSSPTMEKVVSNLSNLDKPWNCPHGRPTIRHLYELSSRSCRTVDSNLK